MRLITVRRPDGATAAGRVEGDEVVVFAERDVGELLQHDDWRDRAAADGPRSPYQPSDATTLIARPPKIWCVGMNYASHLAETSQQTPTHPTLFAKFAVALTGPYDDIELPAASAQVDWEVELAVVIGRGGRATAATAHDHIAGYTIMNDVSMRDWQRRTKQYLQGKTFARATPLGPALVTADELDSPDDGIALSCIVNEEVMQSSTTSDMVFGVAELVAYVSEIAPLEPGDVIATGTPAGIGSLQKPQRFLSDGDVVECRVDGIGALRNRCVRSS